MSMALAIETPNVRRFNLPDLADKGIWLFGRLRERYPHLQDIQHASWLRGLIDSSEVFFQRTDHAVALAQIVKQSLSPKPTVVERFVLLERLPVLSEKATDSEKAAYKTATQERQEEAVVLYERMAMWAHQIGADDMEVLCHSDLTRDALQGVLGKISRREVLTVHTGPLK